jgi:hypothetical protein
MSGTHKSALHRGPGNQHCTRPTERTVAGKCKTYNGNNNCEPTTTTLMSTLCAMKHINIIHTRAGIGRAHSMRGRSRANKEVNMFTPNCKDIHSCSTCSRARSRSSSGNLSKPGYWLEQALLCRVLLICDDCPPINP